MNIVFLSFSRQPKNHTSNVYEMKQKEAIKKNNGGKNRDSNVVVTVELSKVKFTHEIYPTAARQASRQVLIVNEFSIRDGLQCSAFKHFLHTPFETRNADDPMLVIKALHLRTSPNESTIQQCSLRISMLPLKINVDQETLLFILDFYNQLASGGNQTKKQSRATSCHNKNPKTSSRNCRSRKSSESSSSTPIYFKDIVFSPEVDLKFDYKGKKIDTSQGAIASVALGFAQLSGSCIKLKRIEYRFVSIIFN